MITKEFKNYFKPFIDELNKYADGVNKLNKGVNINLIEKCENKLKIKLPETYKLFLNKYNGGELFAVPVGITLTEIYIKEKGLKEKGGSYLDETFDEERRWPNLPKEYIIIDDTCEGDIICIDLKNSINPECKIVKLDTETGEVAETWNKLIDWLMYEMEFGSMLTNYDGTDKE
ncbi:SMI1/KNR4 family protein [Clostridium tarantellae]|nr:SMI1/KNR4 family protein [Clostridium tarantellae]